MRNVFADNNNHLGLYDVGGIAEWESCLYMKPIDRKRKSPSLTPLLLRVDKKKSNQTESTSTVNANYFSDPKLVAKIKGIEIIREEKISEAKAKLLRRSYESSHILDNLASQILKKLG